MRISLHLLRCCLFYRRSKSPKSILRSMPNPPSSLKLHSVSGSQRSRKPRNQPLPHLARGQISPGHAPAPGVGPEYQQFNDSPWSARPQGNTQGHILETHIRTNGRKYGIIYFWVRVGEAGECSLPSDPHSLGLQTSVCPNAPTVHI